MTAAVERFEASGERQIPARDLRDSIARKLGEDIRERRSSATADSPQKKTIARALALVSPSKKTKTAKKKK